MFLDICYVRNALKIYSTKAPDQVVVNYTDTCCIIIEEYGFHERKQVIIT